MKKLSFKEFLTEEKKKRKKRKAKKSTHKPGAVLYGGYWNYGWGSNDGGGDGGDGIGEGIRGSDDNEHLTKLALKVIQQNKRRNEPLAKIAAVKHLKKQGWTDAQIKDLETGSSYSSYYDENEPIF